MSIPSKHVEILIVGAGLAGLSAASTLVSQGREVLVLDKGRGVGGRLAGRQIDGANFDHGAQFMTARDPRFIAQVERWVATEVVTEWYRSHSGQPTGHARWRGVPNMREIAKQLAANIDIILACRVEALYESGGLWYVETDDARTIKAQAVLLTAPVPQSLALLNSGNIALTVAQRKRLQQIDYDACIAVMALLDGPSHMPPPGALVPDHPDINWIGDNQQKGVSALPAITLHAAACFSARHFDAPRDQVGEQLINMAHPWVGARVKHFQVHGWRYSKPKQVDIEPCMVVKAQPTLVLAGDAFAGPRVEGAVLSGWAAADQFL